MRMTTTRTIFSIGRVRALVLVYSSSQPWETPPQHHRHPPPKAIKSATPLSKKWASNQARRSAAAVRKRSRHVMHAYWRMERRTRIATRNVWVWGVHVNYRIGGELMAVEDV
eukprot:scaffold8558_cov294-Alexandrium_tamarense.AAC.2